MKNGKNDNSINCFGILKIGYNLLKSELSNKGINQIQIYLNMIYPKLKELIQNINEIDTIQKRRNFENEINNLVKTSFLDYQKYYTKPSVFFDYKSSKNGSRKFPRCRRRQKWNGKGKR